MTKAFSRISGRIFSLIFSFLSDKQFQMILGKKPLQKYPVSNGGTQVFILGLSLFLLYINKLLDYVIVNIDIYTNNTTLYSECN